MCLVYPNCPIDFFIHSIHCLRGYTKHARGFCTLIALNPDFLFGLIWVQKSRPCLVYPHWSKWNKFCEKYSSWWRVIISNILNNQKAPFFRMCEVDRLKTPLKLKKSTSVLSRFSVKCIRIRSVSTGSDWIRSDQVFRPPI